MEPADDRTVRANLRRYYGKTGWALLIYYGIMNASVLFCQFAEQVIAVWKGIIRNSPEEVLDALRFPTDGVSGYFLAAAIGLVVLFAWKKRTFWCDQIWAKGRPMKGQDFRCLLCVFLSVQMFSQIYATALEILLNMFGFSILEGYMQIDGAMNGFGMFLYGGVLAPVAEEILFRGLVQKTLMPHGKRFAILGSAVMFGLFHGNIIQAPYAFLCGLILGYVAAEYSIGWAMLLHMINNLVLADIFTRVTSGLPELIAAGVFHGVILVFAVLAVVILVVRRGEIRTYRERNPIHPECARCYFSSGGVIAFTVVMGVSMVITFFVFLTRI